MMHCMVKYIDYQRTYPKDSYRLINEVLWFTVYVSRKPFLVFFLLVGSIRTSSAKRVFFFGKMHARNTFETYAEDKICSLQMLILVLSHTRIRRIRRRNTQSIISTTNWGVGNYIAMRDGCLSERLLSTVAHYFSETQDFYNPNFFKVTFHQ